jgi:hypothetical protein
MLATIAIPHPGIALRRLAYNLPSMLAMNMRFISATPAGTGLPPVEGSSKAALDKELDRIQSLS